MASQVANLLTSLVGNMIKPQPATPADRGSNGFERILDAATSSRSEPAPAQPAAKSDTPQAANDTAPKPATSSDTAKAAQSTDTKSADDKDDDKSDNTLAQSLLAALAALGINTEQIGKAAATNDPAALAEVEGALKDLAKQLGMDPKALMQQLAELAKGVAGKDDFAAKLQAFMGEKLGGGDLAPGIAENLAKLTAGLEKLAKAMPTEPQLATPELKVPEAVTSTKASEASDKTETVAAKPETKTEPKADAKPADTVTSAQDKPHANQAERPKAQQDNAVAINAATQNQNTSQNQPDQTGNLGAASRVVQTGYQTSQQQLNLPQLAFEMSRQVQDGNSRFKIRLDPPELGRIDVKLDIDNKGQVHARLTVEKAETLDLMQRDQRALERALQQAGLDQSKTNLEFSLKQNPFAGEQHQRADSEQGGFGGGQDGQEETEVAAPSITLYRGALQASGVNIIA